MPKVNLGWLEDKNGEKFAPKTITTQILTETGKNLDNILKSNEKRLDKKITSPETASVGQLLVVEEIDANGSPVKWRAINAPNNQIQADWEQTDETQVDFVKNKPFYSTIESILYYDSEGDCCAVLEEGKTYSVSINGVLYNDLICTKYYWHQNGGSNCLLLGGTNMDSTDTWNHGFVLYSNLRDSANRIYAISKDTNFNFPIWNSAYSAGKVLTKEDNVDILALNYKTLDDNYIPNTIPRVDTVEVGQTVAVDIVDKNGIPIKWKGVSLNEFVKNTQYATYSTAGLVRALNSYGVSMSDSNLQIYKATSTDIASKTHNYRPIVPSTLDIAVKAGLANSKITWSDSEKQKARNLIGAKSNILMDWNQKNETADDYIANKPLYSYYERSYTPIEIFNNRIEPPVGSDYITYNFSSPLSIEYGDSFDFYINDFLCYSSSKFESATVRFVPYRGAAVTSEVVLTIENVSFHSYDPVNVRIVKTSYGAEIIKQLDEKFIPNNIPKIDSASVGQTIEIKEVDENGKPTKWQAVDLRSLIVAPVIDPLSSIVQISEDGSKRYIVLDNISNADSYNGCLYYYDYTSSNISIYVNFGDYEHMVYFDSKDGIIKITKNNFTANINTLRRLVQINKLSADIVVDSIYSRIDEVLTTGNTTEYTPTGDYNPVTKKYVDDLGNTKVSSPAFASVGQILEVEEVDENGKPIKWKAVDKGSSGANIETDSELLEDSTNPIQNQAVTKEFNTFAGSIEITSNDPVKEKTVLTFNPDAEEINLYTVEEIDNKFSGTVEITDGNPSKENTVITVNPNAEEVNIYTAEEIDNKFSGTVEITNGEPVKENTVLTVNPEAEKINIYTVEEIDEMLQNLPNESGGGVIVDVIDLPTEDIKENSFYRLLTAKPVSNKDYIDGSVCSCVNILPEVGIPLFDEAMNVMTVYYNIQDRIVYGYVDDIVSTSLGVSVGWHDIAALFPYGGIVTDLNDATEDEVLYLLLEKELYSWNGKWVSYKIIGKIGDGFNAEAFNSIRNTAYGKNSHAEGSSFHKASDYITLTPNTTSKEIKTVWNGNYFSLAYGEGSHVEGCDSIAYGGNSHAEGNRTIAEGLFSHAEGAYSHAEGGCSHAEGSNTIARGEHSHAEGFGTTALGSNSHAEGYETIASDYASHVQGKFNIKDIEKKYAHIVGNGTHNSRSNAHTLDWEGNAEYQGDVIARGCGGENPISLISLFDDFADLKSRFDAIVDGSEVAW